MPFPWRSYVFPNEVIHLSVWSTGRAEEEWSVTSEADQLSLAGEFDRYSTNDMDGQQYESSWTAHSMAVETSASQYEVPKANVQSELQLR